MYFKTLELTLNGDYSLRLPTSNSPSYLFSLSFSLFASRALAGLLFGHRRATLVPRTHLPHANGLLVPCRPCWWSILLTLGTCYRAKTRTRCCLRSAQADRPRALAEHDVLLPCPGSRPCRAEDPAPSCQSRARIQLLIERLT